MQIHTISITSNDGLKGGGTADTSHDGSNPRPLPREGQTLNPRPHPRVGPPNPRPHPRVGPFRSFFWIRMCD